MKKLSDYKGEEAILLWGDLLDKFTDLVADKEIADSFRQKKPALLIAKMILKKNPEAACEIMLRVDDTPIDGLNVITRLIVLLNELISDPVMKDFFGLSEEETEEETSSGSVTGNTEESEISNISSNM